MRPNVIAHRGASVEAPENSLAAFARAIDAGAEMIELDVRLTRDGAVVVMHDESLDRTTTGRGRIAELELAEVRRARLKDAGGAPHEPPQVPPLLAEALAQARGRVKVNVEIKPAGAAGDALVRAALAVIDEVGFPPGDLVISSFDHRLLEMVAAARTDLALAPLFQKPIADADFAALPGTGLHPRHTLVDEAFMERARRAGRFVNVWTVNDPQEQRRLIGLGVDGIITDDPRALRALLREYGAGGNGKNETGAPS